MDRCFLEWSRRNDSVLEFYPKFGFVRGTEHIYTQTIGQDGICTMERVRMDSPVGWIRLRTAMEYSEFETGCTMLDNPGLIFFYAAQFMQDCVYHDRRLDAWAIAEMADGELTLHNVFAPVGVTLQDVIASFGAQVRRVILGFTPGNPTGFDCAPYHEEDCTFFVRGAAFDDFAQRKLRIPSLSHA